MRRDKSASRTNTQSTTDGGGRPPSVESLRFNVPRRSSSILSPDSCQPSTSAINDPPRRNAESGRGLDSIIYSPASSTRGTPSSDMFFGSGNTTPSLMMSPPPHTSAFNSPTFSPPISPPPLQPANFGKPGLVDPESALVLQPVPQRRAAAAAASALDSKQTAPKPSPMRQASAKIAAEIDKAMGKDSDSGQSNAKTDVGRLLTEYDTESSTPRATPAREVKKYVRRRYTDSRHPTTELPDVRLEVPENMSVQYPPIRKQQKMKAEEAAANAASSK